MNPLAELKNRDLLSLADLTDGQMLRLIDLAAELKSQKQAGHEPRHLPGRNIALVFEKSSTRTRCAATVAAYDQGAHAEYLGKQDIHLGKKESVRDTARVLARMFDAILFRGYAHQTVQDLATYAEVPVWNGLTDDWHPTQILADLLTVRETLGELKGLSLTFVGDGRNNVCNSLMFGCAKAGIHFVNCCPEPLSPRPDLVARASAMASENHATLRVDHDPQTGVSGANVVYTDVWVSMGEESKFEERIALLRPYQVDMRMMENTGNLDRGRVCFLHCLPAFHDRSTEVTREIGALEVTDDVFEAPFSRVFDEAENRMHTIKAMMVACLS